MQNNPNTQNVRIIVAGSRGFANFDLLKRAFIQTFKDRHYKKSDITIISGTANGADKLGEQYANHYGLNLVTFPADWTNLGKKAGYIRNKQMAQYAVADNSIGILMAFWDGESKGTNHMINLAKEHNLEVNIINYKELIMNKNTANERTL